MIKSVAPILRYRWIILVVCWLAYIVAYLQRLSIGPLAPFLKEDLVLTNTQIGSLVSAAAIGYTLGLIPAGWLVDRMGIRRMLLVGEVVGGIFIMGMFFITSFTSALIFLALAGAGFGSLSPTTTKAILIWFPAKERATAMGLKQTAVNVGGIITATTFPVLALALGWQYGFVVISFAGIVIGVLSFILYKEPLKGVTATVSEIVGSVPKPSLREVFKGRDIWLISFAGMFMAAVQHTITVYFVLYLKEALLFTVVTAGLFLAILLAGGIFGKLVFGLISDHLLHGSRKGVLFLIFCATFAMCLIFTTLQQSSPLWIVAFLGLILGLVAIGWGGLQLTFVGELADKELIGRVVSISTIFLRLGNIAAPPVFGYLIDITGSYRAGWQLLATLAAFAAALLYFLREEKRGIGELTTGTNSL